MPVRSFNLKLVVPRGSADRVLREDLWTTHSEVNTATRYYEERLLCLRAMPYEVTPATEACPHICLMHICKNAACNGCTTVAKLGESATHGMRTIIADIYAFYNQLKGETV